MARLDRPSSKATMTASCPSRKAGKPKVRRSIARASDMGSASRDGAVGDRGPRPPLAAGGMAQGVGQSAEELGAGDLDGPQAPKVPGGDLAVDQADLPTL